MSDAGVGGLESEIARQIRDERWFEEGEPVVVALSGGVDSLVLVHLLRTVAGAGERGVPSLSIQPAHLDHRMRPGSSDDAERVAVLMDDLGLPCHRGAVASPPSSEAEARSLRYGFLRDIRDQVGARWILLGHHADDQRETVLFRILRGTGVRGLRAMRRVQPPDLLRPLLGVDRVRIRAYAERHGLEPVEDPSNRELSWARNRIRHELLPLAAEIHPGAPRALLRLARRAREHEAALDALLDPVIEQLLAEGRAAVATLPSPLPGRGLVVARDTLLSYPAPVRAELLRALALRLGGRLSEAGTATALQFIRRGSSGGRVELPDRLVLARDFSFLRLEREPPEESGSEGVADSVAIVSDLDSETGPKCLGLAGERWEVRWVGARRIHEERRDGASWLESDVGWVTRFRRADLQLPLRIRGRKPGDRAPTSGGRKKLSKLMVELRIPREQRDRIPVLVDGVGSVLWIPGQWRAPLALPDSPSETWTIGVTHVGDGT